MLLNPALRIVFSLDPYFPEYARARFFHGRKVCTLPDPVSYPQTSSVSNKPMPGYIENIPGNRKIFLLFGGLERRKGIFELLLALDYLDDNILGKIAIVFAGRAGLDIREELHRKCKDASSRFKLVWVHLEDRFVPEDELISAVQCSDAILLPYQRFTGSSGPLLWAAGAGKPIITQDYGLMGALTKQYGLGLTVDTGNPRKIAEAIENFAKNDAATFCTPTRMALFVKGKTKDAFASEVLRKITLQQKSGNVRKADARIGSL